MNKSVFVLSAFVVFGVGVSSADWVKQYTGLAAQAIPATQQLTPCGYKAEDGKWYPLTAQVLRLR